MQALQFKHSGHFLFAHLQPHQGFTSNLLVLLVTPVTTVTLDVIFM